jgi:5-methylcytosine-specific restriction endonuclease McrA
MDLTPITPEELMEAVKQAARDYVNTMIELDGAKSMFIFAAQKAYKELTPQDAYNTAYEVFWDNPELPPGLTGLIVGKAASHVASFLVKREYATCTNCGKPIILETKRTQKEVEAICDTCATARRIELENIQRAERDQRNLEWNARYAVIEAERRRKLEELKSMPYSEYLQTEHWKETRTAALKRASYRCQLCNANGQLNVHHRTYENRGHEAKDDLIVLCRNCHSKHHGKDE